MRDAACGATAAVGVPALATKLAHLVSTKGIGEASAMRLLAELLVLPDDLAAPQWVAHAGLDPRPYESGTSVHRPRRITKVGNRHLRAALYMPALVAIQHDPNVKAFYNKLVAAGKKPMQAVVAVMRKLLHAIWGMLKHDQDFDGNKFLQTRRKNCLTGKREYLTSEATGAPRRCSRTRRRAISLPRARDNANLRHNDESGDEKRFEAAHSVLHRRPVKV